MSQAFVSSSSLPTFISESCLTNWMFKADVEEGVKPGTTAADNAELREIRKRIRLLEKESRVLLQYWPICRRPICGGNIVLARPELADDEVRVTVTCRVLKITASPTAAGPPSPRPSTANIYRRFRSWRSNR